MSNIEQRSEKYSQIILAKNKYNLNQRILAEICSNNIKDNKRPIYTVEQIRQFSIKTN